MTRGVTWSVISFKLKITFFKYLLIFETNIYAWYSFFIIYKTNYFTLVLFF